MTWFFHIFPLKTIRFNPGEAHSCHGICFGMTRCRCWELSGLVPERAAGRSRSSCTEYWQCDLFGALWVVSRCLGAEMCELPLSFWVEGHIVREDTCHRIISHARPPYPSFASKDRYGRALVMRSLLLLTIAAGLFVQGSRKLWLHPCTMLHSGAITSPRSNNIKKSSLALSIIDLRWSWCIW